MKQILVLTLVLANVFSLFPETWASPPEPKDFLLQETAGGVAGAAVGAVGSFVLSVALFSGSDIGGLFIAGILVLAAPPIGATTGVSIVAANHNISGNVPIALLGGFLGEIGGLAISSALLSYGSQNADLTKDLGSTLMSLSITSATTGLFAAIGFTIGASIHCSQPLCAENLWLELPVFEIRF